MGGRIASQVAAKQKGIDALALFAYSLHPPWNRSQRRDLHFPDIECPTLFCSGTRDTFAEPHELRQAAGKAPHADVHLLDGADHGFSVLKSSGRRRQDVWDDATSALLAWLGRL